MRRVALIPLPVSDFSTDNICAYRQSRVDSVSFLTFVWLSVSALEVFGEVERR